MSNPVTLDLIKAEGTVPAPDMLIVGPKGVVQTDIVKVRVDADTELKRGTLLMSGTKDSEAVYLPCTAAGLSATGTSFAILADTVEIPAAEHAETAIYFDGDFNAASIIFPWETDADDHAEQVELAREALRKYKIFLRNTHR